MTAPAIPTRVTAEDVSNAVLDTLRTRVVVAQGSYTRATARRERAEWIGNPEHLAERVRDEQDAHLAWVECEAAYLAVAQTINVVASALR